MNSGAPGAAHCRGRRGAGARYARLCLPPSRPAHPTQAWAMEGAAPDGNRGPNTGRPASLRSAPPAHRGPRSAVSTVACKPAPGPRRARPPPTRPRRFAHLPQPRRRRLIYTHWRTKPAEGGSLSNRCPGSVSERSRLPPGLSSRCLVAAADRLVCSFVCRRPFGAHREHAHRRSDRLRCGADHTACQCCAEVRGFIRLAIPSRLVGPGTNRLHCRKPDPGVFVNRGCDQRRPLARFRIAQVCALDRPVRDQEGSDPPLANLAKSMIL